MGAIEHVGIAVGRQYVQANVGKDRLHVPKRRNHEHLPQVEEFRDLPEDEKPCPQCGLPYHDFPGTEDSQTIEVEVRAHRRVIRRKRYRPACSCPGNSGIITAPPAPKLIPKGRYGISLWTQVLLDKFLFFRASHRLIADLATYGITLPQLGRLRFELVSRERSALWNEYIDRYHYLGYTPLVGAQLRYGVYAEDRLLALFG